MHCCCGTDHRMAREWEFFLSREDSGPDDIASPLEIEEDRFELPHLSGDGQQLVGGELASSENDDQTVAAVRVVGEDIDMAEVQARIHAQPFHTVTLALVRSRRYQCSDDAKRAPRGARSGTTATPPLRGTVRG